MKSDSKCDIVMMASKGATMTIPLGPVRRDEQEQGLAKTLAAGRSIVGGIFFTSRHGQFEYLRMEGDTEPPMVQQCPILRAHDVDLGKRRTQSFMMHYFPEDYGHHAKLFMRVLKGRLQLRLQLEIKSRLYSI